MPSSRQARVPSLLIRTLETNPTDRAAFLEAECGGDDALREEIEQLLTLDGQQLESFLETSAAPAGSTPDSAGSPSGSGQHAGAELGRYTLTSLLGRGGMGEVWRARDSTLDREVAIKFLPAALASEPERLDRFRREARVLARLDHPNVASIYGLESTETAHFLVMQLVPGEDLAQIQRQRRLRLGEALSIAQQIAEGLEAAHEKSVVHRDLKPGNVVVDRDGRAVVLDFGLAKVLSDEDDSAADETGAPTRVAGQALTQAGTMMGTAAYMAPEQVEGRAVDARADVWAFGVLLWELVVGKSLFGTDSLSATLTAVLTRELDWSQLSEDVPAQVLWVLQRCLVRDPHQRLRSIGEARILLGQDSMSQAVEPPTRRPGDAGAPEATSLPGGRVRQPDQSESHGVWRWSTLVLFLLSSGLLAVLLSKPTSDWSLAEPRHLAIELPPDTRPALGGIQPGPAVVAPDGRRVAFVAEDDAGIRQIWVRDLDSKASRRLEGTEDASYPFWSPDGADLGFFAGQKLRRVPAAGGRVRTLFDAPTPKGGAWNARGQILFNPSFDAGLSLISAEGGTAQPLTALQEGELSHRFPQFLPDGRHFIYLVRRADDRENSTVFASLEDPGTRREVLRSPVNSVVQGRQVLSFQEGALVARAFDPATGTTGERSVVLLDEVGALTGSARLLASAGPSVLVYQAAFEVRDQLSLVDRSGARLRRLASGTFDNPALSPDGKTLAVHTTLNGNQQVILFDLDTGNREQFTAGPDLKVGPTWSPDGTRIVYSTNASGARQLVSKPYRRGDSLQIAPEVLVDNVDPELTLDAMAWGVDPKGREVLVYSAGSNSAPGHQLMYSTLDGEPDRTLLQTASGFPEAEMSPDGRWLSFRTGTDPLDPTIYVTDLPLASRRFEVTDGWHCRWLGDGDEMLCLDSHLDLVSFEVRDRGTSFEWGPPEVLFRLRNRFWEGDGERFVISEPAEDDRQTTTLGVLLDWELLLE